MTKQDTGYGEKPDKTGDGEREKIGRDQEPKTDVEPTPEDLDNGSGIKPL